MTKEQIEAFAVGYPYPTLYIETLLIKHNFDKSKVHEILCKTKNDVVKEVHAAYAEKLEQNLAPYMVKAKHKQNGIWFYGVPMKIKDKYMLLLEDDNNLLRVHYTEDKMWDVNVYAVEIDEKTICRPTGKRDKNGYLIWENDICNCPKRGAAFFRSIIIWNQCKARFDVRAMECNFPLTLDEKIDGVSISCMDYEVIGNTFDNPELL